MKFLLFSFLALLVCVNEIHGQSEDEVVREFVLRAMNESYADWIGENSFDPTPPNTNDVNVDYSNTNGDNIHATFSNLSANGLSKFILVTEVRVDMEERYLYISYATKMTYEGTYKANGTINSNVTVTGDGNWSAEVEGLGYILHAIAYRNFDLIVINEAENGTENGTYIDLTFADTYSITEFAYLPPEGQLVTLISGLEAGGHEPDVKIYLLYSYYEAAESSICTRDNPTVKYADMFLQSVFMATPIEDMGSKWSQRKLPFIRPNKEARQGNEYCLDHGQNYQNLAFDK